MSNAELTDDYIQANREQIGKAIRLRREELGYSQDDLAAVMQIHRSTISKVENGKFSITVDYLIRFGFYLDFHLSIEPN